MTIEISRTDAGVCVATDRVREVESVSLGVWVDVGSRDERADENGISHMLEHMVFKGTRQRSAIEIAEEIEMVGGQLNAHTTRDHTAFYARILKDDTELALRLIADLINDALLDPEELRREQDVILQEIGQAHDTPDDIVFDHLMAASFPDQSLGRAIMGSPASVRGLTRDHLERFLSANYRGERLTVVAAGNIDHEAIVRLAEALFAAPPAPGRPAARQAVYRPGEQRDDRPLDQLLLTLAFPGVGFRDPGHYAQQVLATLLGGGMSSRLFQSVRERHGLAYSIYSFIAGHPDTGMLVVEAGTGAESADQLLALTAQEFQSLADTLGKDELARAKAQLKAGMLMALESLSVRAERLATQLQVHGRMIPTDETVAHIEAVSRSDIIDQLERLTAGPALSLAAVGPCEPLGELGAVQALFRPD